MSFFSYPLISMFAVFFVYIGAQMLPGALKIVALYGTPPQQNLLGFLQAVFPNFSAIDLKYACVWGGGAGFARLINICVYSLSYLVCMSILAIAIFRKKDF